MASILHSQDDFDVFIGERIDGRINLTSLVRTNSSLVTHCVRRTPVCFRKLLCPTVTRLFPSPCYRLLPRNNYRYGIAPWSGTYYARRPAWPTCNWANVVRATCPLCSQVCEANLCYFLGPPRRTRTGPGRTPRLGWDPPQAVSSRSVEVSDLLASLPRRRFLVSTRHVFRSSNRCRW